MSPKQHDWDLLLPYAEFALNSSHSAIIGFSPAYTLYGHEPNFPLEVVVRSVNESRVASVSDRVACISDVVQSVHMTLVQPADSMSKQANCKCCDVDV